MKGNKKKNRSKMSRVHSIQNSSALHRPSCFFFNGFFRFFVRYQRACLFKAPTAPDDRYLNICVFAKGGGGEGELGAGWGQGVGFAQPTPGGEQNKRMQYINNLVGSSTPVPWPELPEFLIPCPAVYHHVRKYKER